MIRQPLFQAGKLLHRSRLRRVRRDGAGRKKFGIAERDGRNHAGSWGQRRVDEP